MQGDQADRYRLDYVHTAVESHHRRAHRLDMLSIRGPDCHTSALRTCGSMQAVLKTEFPQGMNIIYESVGGDMFKTCLGALGRQGRLVVIGMMSQYGAGWPQTALKGVPEMLLAKSASLNGFFLVHYASMFRKHLRQLTQAMLQGQLKVNMDSTVFRYVLLPKKTTLTLPVTLTKLRIPDLETHNCTADALFGVKLQLLIAMLGRMVALSGHYIRKLVCSHCMSYLGVTCMLWCAMTLHRGVEAAQDAVEHLQSGISIGKAYIQIASELPSQASSRL